MFTQSFTKPFTKPFARPAEVLQVTDTQAHPSQRFPSGRSRPTRMVAEGVTWRMVMTG